MVPIAPQGTHCVHLAVRVATLWRSLDAIVERLARLVMVHCIQSMMQRLRKPLHRL